MRNLKIDAERLWGGLMETAAIGATPKGGICRLTLTDLDRAGARLVPGAGRGARLPRHGRRHGRDVRAARRAAHDVPPIAMGSHLDTQPTGGKFDGVLGVLGALEALRALVEAGYETYRADRGRQLDQRGGLALRAGDDRLRRVRRRVRARLGVRRATDRAGVRFGEALEAIGYRGPERCGDHPLSAFFELHIEQGPILEAEGKEIGVVTGVQGMRWFEVTIVGQECAYRRHADATCARMRCSAPPAWSSGSRRSRTRIAPLAVGDRRADRGQAEFAQRGAGRGVPHHRPAPSRDGRARRRWSRPSCRRRARSAIRSALPAR